VSSLAFTVTPLATFISISTLLYKGTNLDASDVFTTAILIDLLNKCLGSELGFHVRNVRDGNVSIVRIQDFLHTTYQKKIFS
jgi:hypothetical protein